MRTHLVRQVYNRGTPLKYKGRQGTAWRLFVLHLLRSGPNTSISGSCLLLTARSSAAMSRLRAILERKNQRKAILQSALDLIVDQLREMGALRIVLFGSLATGEVDVNSDIDILVVMPETKNGKEWSRLIYDSVERGAASDIVVFNRKELETELPINSFLRRIIDTGRVVYEKTSQR
jgi:predicted nucleotidyltransferase